MRLSPCVLVQPDGWARGEREGYGGPYDVTSLSLSLANWTLAPNNTTGGLVDQKREQKKLVYRSPYAQQRALLLRDLRERRVEEVVDGDHAVALVERI